MCLGARCTTKSQNLVISEFYLLDSLLQFTDLMDTKKEDYSSQ